PRPRSTLVPYTTLFRSLTAHPDDPIEETAKVLRENKIGAMPVMDEGRLVGIVTGIDMLDALVRMSGVYEAASRIEVEVANRPGADRKSTRLNSSHVKTS